MKAAFSVGAGIAIAIFISWGLASSTKTLRNSLEQTKQTFQAECAAVNGRAVWNGTYWECLK